MNALAENRPPRSSSEVHKLTSIAGLAHDLAKLAGVIELRAHALRRAEELGCVRADARWIEECAHDLCVSLRGLIDDCRSEHLVPADEIELDELVTRVVEIATRAHGERVVVARSEGLPTPTRSAGVIERILLNLLDNALRAAPPAEKVALRMSADKASLRICVSNRGPRIPDEIAGSLFEPFVSSRARCEGSGLGLFICRELSEQLGGTIDLRQSECGETDVTVALPIERL